MMCLPVYNQNVTGNTSTSAVKETTVNVSENIIVIEDAVEKYGKQIYVYCYHMLNNKHEAEDAVQDIFLKAFNYGKLRDVEAILLWLYKTAYHHCLNLIKRKRFFEFISLPDNLISNENNPQQHMEMTEFSEEIQNALCTLTGKQRTVLLLRTIRDFSYDEIAVIVCQKPQTVRKQYERARKKVMAYLNSKGGMYNEKSIIV